MYALNLGAIDEDFAERARLRQALELTRIELESEVGTRIALRVALEIIGPEHRGDGVDEPPEYPVVVLARNVGEVLLDGDREALQTLLATDVAQIEIETGPEQFEQFHRDAGIARQRVGNVVLRIVHAGLAQVARDGAQHHGLAGAEPGADDEAVEAVIVDLVTPDTQEGVLQPLGIGFQIEIEPVGARHLHVMQQNRAPGIGRAADRKLVGLLADHPEAEIFEKRHPARQRQRRIGMEDLEAEMVFGIAFLPVERDLQSTFGFQAAADIGDIAHRRARIVALLVGLADDDAIGRLAADGGEFVLPARDERLDVALELVVRDFRRLALVAPDDEVDARHPALREGRVKGRQPAVVGDLEIGADLLAHVGIVLVARNVNHNGYETIKAVDARQHAHTRPVGEFVDLAAEPRQEVGVDLEEFVAGIGFERVQQKLARMAVRVVAEIVDHPGDLRAQQRDFGHRARIGGGGEEADHPQLTGDIALLVEPLDADIVHMGAAVDDGTDIGLGDDKEIRPVQEIEDFRRRHHLVLALPQHKDVGIGEDAEAARAGAGEFAAAALLGVDVFAHAEEGEIVVAQPREEGERLVARIHLVLVDAQIGEIGGGRIDPQHHRLPVLDGAADLAEHERDPLHQHLAGLLAEPWHVQLDVADRVLLRPVDSRPVEFQRLAVADIEDRVGGQEDFSDLRGHLAHHRIIEERLVAGGDAENGDGPAVAGHVVGLDERDARRLAVPGPDLLLRPNGNSSEILRRVLRQIVGAGAGKQHIGIDCGFVEFGHGLLDVLQDLGDRVVMRGCHIVLPRLPDLFWPRERASARLRQLFIRLSARLHDSPNKTTKGRAEAGGRT